MSRPISKWAVASTSSFMNACQTGAFFFTPTTLMPIIVQDFKIPISLSTIPIAVGKISYVFLLVPGGMLVDAVGPRKTVLVGVAILATSMIFYALLANTFALLIFFHIVMAASAAVSGVPVYSIFIAQWFTHENLGLAMGLVLAGYSAAGTLFPMLLGAIADTNGWQISMMTMALILFFLALPISYFFLIEKNDYESEVESESDSESGPQPEAEHSIIISQSPSNTEVNNNINVNSQLIESPRPQLVIEEDYDPKSWTFFGFAFSYILLQYCNGCFLENIMFYLSIDRGMSLALSSVFFSSLNLAAFIAKIVGGHLGDKYDRFHVAAGASALCSVGITFLFIGGPGLDEDYFPRLTSYPFPILVFAILYGFGYGGSFNSLYALVPIVFGTKNLGRTQSTFFGVGLAGNAAGSVITSVLRSKYGSYQRAFLVAFVTCVCNFFVFNATRISLGGSMKAFKELEAEEEVGSSSGYFAGVDELDAAEEAARLRVGDLSDSGTDTRMTPHGSTPNFYAQGVPIPSSDSLTHGMHTMIGTRLQATPNTLSFLNADTPEASPHFGEFIESPSNQNRRFPFRYPESGMVPSRGYPIPRDWSSSSLRRNVPSVTDLTTVLPPPAELPTSSSAIPIPGMGVRKSSTLEAMIDSGILSASLESVGYLGQKSSIGRRPNRRRARVPSFVNSRNNQGSTSRNEGLSQGYGATTSEDNGNDQDATTDR